MRQRDVDPHRFSPSDAQFPRSHALLLAVCVCVFVSTTPVYNYTIVLPIQIQMIACLASDCILWREADM
jgi:hypothetical protein